VETVLSVARSRDSCLERPGLTNIHFLAWVDVSQDDGSISTIDTYRHVGNDEGVFLSSGSPRLVLSESVLRVANALWAQQKGILLSEEAG
jgi:hypothetical protein